MKRCDRCKFWVKEKEESLDGACRRNPPVPFLQMVTSPITQQKGVMVLGYWCNTRPELWCGDHRDQTLLIRLWGYVARRVIGFLLVHRSKECLPKEESKNILTAVSPNQKTSLN